MVPERQKPSFPRIDDYGIAAKLILLFLRYISFLFLLQLVFFQILAEMLLIKCYVVVSSLEERLQCLLIDVHSELLLVLNDPFAPDFPLLFGRLHLLSELFFLLILCAPFLAETLHILYILKFK